MAEHACGVVQQERDPAELAAQADRDAELALQTVAALRAGMNPGAIEGYVPRGRGVPSPPATKAAADSEVDAALSAAFKLPAIPEDPHEHAGLNRHTAADSHTESLNYDTPSEQNSAAASAEAPDTAGAANGNNSSSAAPSEIQLQSSQVTMSHESQHRPSKKNQTVPDGETEGTEAAAEEREPANASALDSLPGDAEALSMPQQPVLVCTLLTRLSEKTVGTPQPAALCCHASDGQG